MASAKAADSTEARDRPAMTPGPAGPRRVEGIWGDTPRPPVWGCPPFTLARRHSTHPPKSPGLGLPPASPSPGANRTPPQDPRYGCRRLHPRQAQISSALPSEGSPMASGEAADSTEARDRCRYDPRPRRSSKGERNLGDTPDPRYGGVPPFTLARRKFDAPKTPSMGLPPPSPSPDAIRRTTRLPAWDVAPFTLARRHSTPVKTSGMVLPPDSPSLDATRRPLRLPVWGCRPLRPRQAPIVLKPKEGGQCPPSCLPFR
jgi:hypothetical protein